MIKPILEAAGLRPIIIISPLPRFLLRGCCNSTSHIPNLSSPDYRRNLEDSIFDCRKNLKDFAFRLGMRNVRILGPWNGVCRLSNNIWSTDRSPFSVCLQLHRQHDNGDVCSTSTLHWALVSLPPVTSVAGCPAGSLTLQAEAGEVSSTVPAALITV